MKNTKRTLMSSAIALLLCFSMLLGTTFAWFTDSASSAGNIIQSGNLNIEMHWSENMEDWNVVDGSPIFTYDNWEPGYTDVKYVKVKNVGSLAFKWQLNIEAEGAVGELAEVIDVYYISTPTAKITSLDGLTSVGILSEVITNKVSIGGNLLPVGTVTDVNTPVDYIVGETVIAIAFHMDEEAGNKYQNQSIGDGFDISLVATQLSFESDSFGNTYDELAEWPNNVVVNKTTITQTVDVAADNTVANAVSMPASNGVSAEIPVGVKLEAGTSELTLTVTPMDYSDSNIVLDENEAMLTMDVHIEGVAADNDVVMAIKQEKLLPKGLNMGNYRLYHVENGETVAMTLRADGATPVHNNFDYDPATGDTVLYLKSFSPVAYIAEPAAWEGKVDHSWYNANANELVIANADQLWSFSQIVGGMADGIAQDSFGGKTVKLVADIDLGYTGISGYSYSTFYPIGYGNNKGIYVDKANYQNDIPGVESAVYSFEGTFDGNGNTIKNFYQNTWDMFGDYNDGYSSNSNHYKDGMGLFGYVKGGTVKNLTVEKFSSDGEFTPTGVIAAYACNATFENIAIRDCNPRVYNTGNGGIVGIGGNSDDPDTYKLTFKNITVDNTNKITALWGSWDVACGGLVGMFRGAGHAYMTNCHVAAQIDVYNDVCGNYQYYWYRYAGMMIGTNKNMVTDANGYTVPETTKYHAENCTVHFGDWNDYYYCELVANSLASYTHDHQFSRLTEVKKVEGTTITPLEGAAFTVPTSGRYNYVVVTGAEGTENAECYHFVDGAVWNHVDGQYETTDINGDGVVDSSILKEDKQHIYLPFNQLFTGYGWGVKHIPVYNGEDYAFDGIKILDRDVADSITKFVVKTQEVGFGYNTSEGDWVVKLGDLFEAMPSVEINNDTVVAYVSPSRVGEDIINATFNKADNWEDSTITFHTDCAGWAKIVISDYTYCTETVIEEFKPASGDFVTDEDDDVTPTDPDMEEGI